MEMILLIPYVPLWMLRNRLRVKREFRQEMRAKSEALVQQRVTAVNYANERHEYWPVRIDGTWL